MDKDYPVFFDPDDKRWPRVKLTFFWGGLFVSFILFALIASILINPVLQSLSLPSSTVLPNKGHAAPSFPSVPSPGEDTALLRMKYSLEQEINASQFANDNYKKSSAIPDNALTVGFFVNWDDSSFSSLKDNLDYLDVVVGEWLHLSSSDGTLKEDNAVRQKYVTDYIAVRKPQTKILALVNNFDGKEWQQSTLKSMLAEKESRQRTIRQLFSYVQRNHLGGVNIDFENIPPKSQLDLCQFMQELYAEFHMSGLLVIINAPAFDDTFQYKTISHFADYIILMAYDEHWSTSKPGSISGIGWFTDIIERRQREIPTDKMIIGMGNYAYDWERGKEAQVKTFEEAVLTAKDSEGNIIIDPVSLNPTFTYTDENDRVHQVWMLDATSVFNAVAMTKPLRPAGYALWRLGSEDPSVWKIFGKEVQLDYGTAQQLTDIHYAYDLDYEGRGEILKIRQKPTLGEREIIFNQKRGLITSEKYIIFPSPYIIDRYGWADHKIALTFDDGPDPEFTPLILDELKKNKVPATFFVIGKNGQEHPMILRREISEGHDIGNHTFTHPNISEISMRQLGLEVSATERLFEAITGRGSHLFRSPYSEDTEPETQDEVRPVEYINKLGYIMIGMKLDPGDWKSPGVDVIVKRAVDQAEMGNGNIMLLHDGGGDRSQTVRALSPMIQALKSKGYSFVSISQLLGKSRDEIMPPISGQNFLTKWGTRLGFGMLYFGAISLHGLFLIGIILGLTRLFFVVVLAIYEKLLKKRSPGCSLQDFSVAVVVPAFNEQRVITQTIASLLAAAHPKNFEVIIVDDGSTDDTMSLVRSAFGDDPSVRIFSTPNRGKPSALNYGIGVAEAEIIITLDADTIFTEDTIQKLVRHFSDPSVGAVAGNAKVGNRINLLTRWQALEYITSQNLDRRALSVLNSITVVPGSVGAWRHTVLNEAGGFSSDTLAEDTDLTLKIIKLGYRVEYEESAIGLTEAPATVKEFVNQRYRWMFGTFQSAWKHINAFFRPRYGFLGFFALPNIFIYQIFFPLISPVMDLSMIVALISTGIDRLQHPVGFSANNLKHLIFYYALFIAADFLIALIAFLLERREDKTLLVWLFLQRFFYRQLMYYVALKSIVASLRGREVAWNKLERKGTVTAPGRPPGPSYQ